MDAQATAFRQRIDEVRERRAAGERIVAAFRLMSVAASVSESHTLAVYTSASSGLRTSRPPRLSTCV
jgi:hypothetical protein